ncbi:MAG TPA: hypothetical protein DEG17_22165 [Cyanobacteria bacterium UBA11149]|nr:hypothetical protein [Cyanobacteria bacterium UBA11367]HBE59377.1 hypothetical protein [Cyanobacteria bacterium UBA11366]HBK63257.1 hypothetical protein [Cyanobacteria bacterium UBA11166]HBR75049.1 hypothetical protein [Cyanobacteria bacterium UBA11159]HBS68686.1 hypothetical protein [Cyanobacteria bacterium UBA11153]HBW91488.1 hypothetical protein [Cyanobacteria bacterium UBA11149]HCA96272.1 hypothetical protein [Cyanobacteria bacterium UBA9226]
MADTLQASSEGIATIERAIRRKGWTKTQTPLFWEAAHTSQATLRRFWLGKRIQRETFIAICAAVGISNWQGIAAQNTFEDIDLPNDVFTQVTPLPSQFSERRLAAIVFTDAVNFSMRMAANEEQTLGLIRRDLQMMASVCSHHQGRVLKFTGDGLLMYFTSAIEAVSCALDIQANLADATVNLSDIDIIEHRFGIHLGDVFFSDGDVMGNGVNIASRLQTQAAPGGICMSQTVYDVVKSTLNLHATCLGVKDLKNITETILVYQIGGVNVVHQNSEKLETKPAQPIPIQENLNSPSLPLPTVPEGAVHLDSIFYITRSPIEENCYEEITRPGGLIRLKAPRQMGKTSLLDRIIDYGDCQDYQTIRLNLLQAEASVFSSVERFFRWFCACVSQKLRLPSQVKDYWDEDRGSLVNCTIYFEAYLLESIDSPLVLGLDEVDRIFQFPEIAQSFFPMLRSWHEEAKMTDIWEKLRIVVVHSTEDYGTLDINQSPFNVGLSVELPEFTAQQVKDLAQRHQLKWNDTEVAQLVEMVGGHPYLVRLALYHIARSYVTLEKLLKDAPTEGGIYEEHLRRHWVKLKENPQLLAGLQQVVTASEAVRLETMQAYQLYSMGLIKRHATGVIPRCELYRQYLRSQLFP